MGIGSKFQKFKDKVFDDIIPNELKSGAKAKESLRKLIPNELADIAVKAAPFVAMIPWSTMRLQCVVLVDLIKEEVSAMH